VPETSFSALIPSVLRLLGSEHSGGVHLAAQEARPLAEWGRCFQTEDDVDRVLQQLEPLLVLLSVAGYGVPEVVLSAQGVPQSERISVGLPSLELKRGTARSWEAIPSALIGLRVCPTAVNPLDLAAELAAFKPGFGPTSCGWLLLKVPEADPLTSLGNTVQKLLPALSKKVGAASGGIGVAALIDKASAFLPVSPLPLRASFPDLVDKASLKIKAVGALGVLEAEFAADLIGTTLSEQMQGLAGSANNLWAEIESKGVVATTAEVLWDYWQDDEPAADPQDTPSPSEVDRLGWIRALLSFVGTTDVEDTGAVDGSAEPQAEVMPLAQLMKYRKDPKTAKKADWTQLPFIRAATGTIDVAIKEEFTFIVSTQWDDQAKKFKRLTNKRKLLHTLDFGQTRFELEHAARDLPDRVDDEEGEENWKGEKGDEKKQGTVYLLPDTSFKGVSIFPAYLPAAGDPGIAAADIKALLGSGDASERRFWCSALTMWTLAAAGYKLLANIPGSDGLEFAYREWGPKKRDTWTKLDLYMLFNPQPEAVLAAGLIVEEHRGAQDAKTGWSSWPVLGSIPSRVVDLIDSKIGPIEIVDGKPRRADSNSSEVVLTKNSLNLFSGFPRESFYDSRKDLAGRNFDDNPAVMGAPGALAVLGLGHRVAFQDIRPGDIAQRFATTRSGSGHSFQIWAVQIAGTAPAGTGVQYATPSGVSNKGESLYILTKDTEPNGIQVTRTVAYQALESNVPLKALGLDNNGGVTITDWEDVPAEPARDAVKGTTSKDRFYFARLHESPWSAANLSARSPAASKNAQPNSPARKSRRSRR
jgi:hypothetical protein